MELLTSILNLLAAFAVAYAAWIGLKLLKRWEERFGAEKARMEFIYDKTFTKEGFDEFEDMVKLARERADDDVGTYRNSLRTRIDRRK